MDIKNKLKDMLKGEKQKEKERLYESYDIDFKIETFLNWSSDTLEYSKEEVLNFINKMAIWYEFKYPNNVLNNSTINSLNILKNKDNNINKLLKEEEKEILEDITNFLGFDDLFSIKTFLSILDEKELKFLKQPKFFKTYDALGLDLYVSTKLYFTKNAKLTNALSTSSVNQKIKPYLGQKINEILPELKDKKLICNYDFFALNKEYNNYQNKLLFKEKLLDIVLYKIIKNGITKEGIKRGYLFAKEFKRDINIPISYMTNMNFNRDLVNEYLKEGGNPNLICNHYYLSKFQIETPLKYLLKQNKEITKEELELQKKLILLLKNELTNHQDELRNEEIKQKRIERKLSKSRDRK